MKRCRSVRSDRKDSVRHLLRLVAVLQIDSLHNAARHEIASLNARLQHQGAEYETSRKADRARAKGNETRASQENQRLLIQVRLLLERGAPLKLSAYGLRSCKRSKRKNKQRALPWPKAKNKRPFLRESWKG